MNWNIDRRTFLMSLPAVAAAPTLLARARRRVLSSAKLNHVEIAVSNTGRTIEFYQELLGMPIQTQRGSTTILRLGEGPQYMAVRPTVGGETPWISRMGISVDDFDLDNVVRELEAGGVTSAGGTAPEEKALRMWTTTRSAGGGGGEAREVFFGDPSGLVVQVVDRSHCGGDGALGNACGPMGASDEGLLTVLDWNHCTNGVSDPEASRAFFEDVFGLTVQVYQGANPTYGVGDGFQFLMFTGGGAAAQGPPRGAINHACMTVEDFDVDRILGILDDFGIGPRAQGESPNEPLRSSVSMRMPDRGGVEGGTPELYFSDPDGLRMQLQDPSYCGGGGYLGSVC